MPLKVRTFAALVALSAASALASPVSAFVWPNVPEQVARALASGDVVERRVAAARLADLPPEIGREIAVKAISDPDVEVRIRVAAAAVALRLRKGGDLVMPWLTEGDSRLRLAACDVIRASPTDRSVVALGRVLGDPVTHVRFAAAGAMGMSGLPEAVSPLLGHLDDSSPEVRSEVARALGRLGDTRAVVPLIGKVQDSVPEVRRTVARALGELGDLRATSALMLALQDAAGEVRLEVVTALGRLKSDEATLAIASLVDRGDGSDGSHATSRSGSGSYASAADVRAAALRALGQIGSPASVKVLTGALAKDDPAAVRSPVRDALATAGQPSVKAMITVLGGSPNASSASGATLVLGALKAKEGIDPIVRAMQRGIVPLRYGLRSLAQIGAPSALPMVLEMMDDADPTVRKEAISAASALLDPENDPSGKTRIDGRPVDPASAALRDAATPVDEKIELVKLLGRTGAPRASAVLLPLVKAKPNALRMAVLDALGMLATGGPEVDAALVKALDDEANEVRLHAAMSLSKVGTKGVSGELLRRLSVAAEQDRGAIGIALSGALSRADDPRIVAEAERLVPVAPDAARDALIEGLGRMRGPVAAAALASLAARHIDDRRKVAEALAGHPELVATIRKLARDPDPAVRANAVWSLGRAGTRADVDELAKLLRDPDAAVAGNAAAAIGRVAAKEGVQGAAATLCSALIEARPYVRANAIQSLSLLGADCSAAAPGPRTDAQSVTPRELLVRDPSESVRLAAADFVDRAIRKAKKPNDADRRALVRCAAEDRSATVALRCGRRSADPSGTSDISVYVVPDSRTVPQSRAPFALLRADGFLRMGLADRRGAVFEFGAPRGEVRLAVPAQLVR